MEKQATNRVSTIKLPDGQYTRTGRETLKELFRGYFPDSRLTEDSNNGPQQLKLDVCKSRRNGGDWNLVRNIIEQSKIRWALGAFKPIKSGGTDATVLALLQQRWNI
jgi:hypothetical protein